MMSVATLSQPSLPTTGRVGIERLRQVIDRSDVVALGRISGRFGAPHDSLNGTQVTMHGWLTSRSITFVHSRISRRPNST